MRQQLNNGGLAKLIAKMSPEQKAYYDTLPDTQKEGYLKSLGLDGMSAGTGMAIAAGAELAGQAVQAIDQNDGTLSPEGNVASKALQYGGKGAGIGTMIAPGVGTAIGAGAGALLGAGMGLMENKKNKDDQNQADKAARHAAGQASMDVAGRIGAKDGGKIGAASGLVESILGPIAPKHEPTALIQPRQGKAQGGAVVGPGGPKEDAVDTQLPENSFVVPAENAVIAKQLREMYLNKPTKKMKGGGSVPVSLSNGEHVFMPEEVSHLEKQGINLHYLAPNAEQTGMGYQKGGRVGYKNGTPKEGVQDDNGTPGAGLATEKELQIIEELLDDPNMQAYLEGVRHGEEDPKAGLKSQHPETKAQGSFQFLPEVRKNIMKKYGYDAWSDDATMQALAAIALIYDNTQWGTKDSPKSVSKDLIKNIKEGKFDEADKVLAERKQWTSLPGGTEKNSKTDTIPEVRKAYQSAVQSGKMEEYQKKFDPTKRFSYLVNPDESDAGRYTESSDDEEVPLADGYFDSTLYDDEDEAQGKFDSDEYIREILAAKDPKDLRRVHKRYGLDYTKKEDGSFEINSYYLSDRAEKALISKIRLTNERMTDPNYGSGKSAKINTDLTAQILAAETPEQLKEIYKKNSESFDENALKAFNSKRDLLWERRNRLPGDSVMTAKDYNDLLQSSQSTSNRLRGVKPTVTKIESDLPEGLVASVDEKVRTAWQQPLQRSKADQERSKRMEENAKAIRDSKTREKLDQLAVNAAAGVPVTTDGLSPEEQKYYEDRYNQLLQTKKDQDAATAEIDQQEEMGLDYDFQAPRNTDKYSKEVTQKDGSPVYDFERNVIREKISNPEVFQNKPAPEADRINVLESLGGFRGLLAIGQTAMGLAGVLSKKGDPGDYTPDPTLMRLRDEAILDSTRMDPAIKASAETNMELTRRATNETIQQQAGGDTGLALANMNRSAIAKNRAIVDLAAEQERTSMQKKQYAAGLAGQVAGERRYGYDQRRNDFVANQQAAAGLMNTGLENLIQGQMYRSWNEGLKKIEDQQKSYQQKMTEDFNNMFKNNDKPSGGTGQ